MTFTAATNTIEIGQQQGAGSDSTGAASASSTDAGKTLDREPITDFEQLYGTWGIWTPGGATNLYWTDTGNYATHEYTAGADQGTVIIHADGTYEMDYGIWGQAEGSWRLTFPGEINGERVLGIVLLDGPGGDDWAVAPSVSGDTVRLLSSMGTWADGSSAWLFDSELYKK